MWMSVKLTKALLTILSFITIYLCSHRSYMTNIMQNIMQKFYLLPPATKLGQGNVFTGVCDSVNRGGCYPSMHCRWYPGMPCSRSPGGGGLLQEGVVPGPEGEGVPTPGGKGWGWPSVMAFCYALLVWWSSGGGAEGYNRRPPHQKAVTVAWWRPSPRTATAAGGTHPTGMHSCGK